MEKDIKNSLDVSWREAGKFVNEVRLKNSDFSSEDVFKSIQLYLEEQIENSLQSQDHIVKMLAILDRRVGKRTLSKLKDESKICRNGCGFSMYCG